MKRLPLVVLESSTILSGVANGISMIAFPWLVLELTGRPAAAAAIGAITALPLAVSFLFAGVIVDIVGRRRVAVVSDVLSMVSVALVPILAATVGLSFGLLAALAVLGAVFDPAGISGREAMLPEVAAASGMRRERVNGIHEASWGTAYLIGPGIGGFSVGFFGGEATFWLAAVLFAASSVVILFARFPGAGRPQVHERPASILSGTAEGIRFVWRDRTLRAIAIIGMIVVGFWLPVEGVILPSYFQANDQPERLGISIMALALGGVFGALLYSAYGHRWNQRRTFTLALLGAGVAVLVMALLPPFGLFLAAAVAAGIAYGPVGPVQNLVMQNRTPFALRGRVISLLTSAAYVAGPVGYVVAGPAIEVFGVQQAFLLMASVVLSVGVASLFLPGMRGMDDPPVDGGPGTV
jgi:MFS family permease